MLPKPLISVFQTADHVSVSVYGILAAIWLVTLAYWLGGKMVVLCRQSRLTQRTPAVSLEAAEAARQR